MIVGVGIDLCDISRIEKLLTAQGERFCLRILTDNELSELKSTNKLNAKNLAKRFAVKEAVAKALGCGIGGKLSFQDIQINHNHNGKPQVEILNDKFSDILLEISITDERKMAGAFAVAFTK